MPRATKEKDKNNELDDNKKSKKVSTIKSAKKEVSKKSSTKNGSKKVAQKSTVKSKKIEVKTQKEKKQKTEAKNSAKKSSLTEKKTSTRKSSTSKATKVAKKKSSKSNYIPEYYDLPYKYNQTVVKLLAQTPKKLFIYWEISDKDREKFIQKYGEYFFNDTKPVIIIHNLTMNYSFEIDINDFANCWYIDINDPDCLYDIELGRRPITFTENIQTPYIYISSSNDLQAPNNHILFEKLSSILDFKNTKTKQISKKAIANLTLLKDLNAIYGSSSFYEFYKKLYGENLLEELANTRLNNPSSGAISAFK